MSFKAIPMSFTFTARSPKLPPLRLSPEARQRIREQLLAMKASMDAFTRQMQAVAGTPLNPHVVVQVARASREKKPKPA